MKIFAVIALVLTLSCAGEAKACDGHFEYRTQTVLVCGGYYQTAWNGYQWVNYYYPPRYECRQVRVWVPEFRGSGGFSLNWNWRAW